MNRAGLIAVCLLMMGIHHPAIAQDSTTVRPLLNIIFPSSPDTVNYSQIRISGSTRPGAMVNINQIPVKVYASGGFVDRVKLSPRDNEIIITASDSLGDTTAVLKLFREPPLPISPARPTEIDNRIIWPDNPVKLLSGDVLEVRFKGSPGGRAMFKIDKLCKNIPMTELDPEEAQGMQGIYSGVVRLYSKKIVSGKSVQFELKGIDGKKAKAKSSGLVTVIPDQIPLIGETIEQTYLKPTPYAFTVMSILPPGVRFHVVGERNKHLKVRLSENEYAYINGTAMRLLPVGTPTPKTSIGLPWISYNQDWIQLNMNINTRCPFTVQQTIDPARLELTVYGARLTSQWISYPEADATIKLIRWQQVGADVFKLFVELNQRQQWGHRVRFDSGRMILEIRRAPKIATPPQSPVADLVFALDAGHGGVEKGAVGSTGLMEKDVNLIYSKKLAALLDSAGATVVLTREEDVQMSLADRVEKARQANAHIFCWLHNNSVGATSDAARVRGASTYFTVPQNMDLAWTVYPQLLEIGLQPFGRVQSDYFVTRQTDMLVVLVEGAFMSNPEDEMLLMDEVFLDRLARAVFRGLEEFCLKQQ